MSKNPYKKKRSKGISRKAKDADKQMHETSTGELVNTIDYLISILKGRGVYIVDFDDRNEPTKRTIGMVRLFKGKPYYMATTKEEVEKE